MRSPATAREKRPKEENSRAALALSTSWNAQRCLNGDKLIFEIKELGFEEVELSFNLAPSVVEDIARLTKDKTIKVSSVHNFCPIPEGLTRETALPDCYSMSSLDTGERQHSIKYTKKTIDTAQRLNARAVVLHSGRIDIPDRTKELIGLYEKGLRNSEDFNSLKNEIIRERKVHAKPFLENTLKSLDEINRYAVKCGISLGIETRFYCYEIPAFEEIGIILKCFEGGNVYYWHDTGHAQVMGNLGFAGQKDFLEAYKDRLLGIHLHNVCGCKDHQAPCRGDINFRLFRPYLGPKTIKVIEAHYPATAQDLVKSRALLEEICDA